MKVGKWSTTAANNNATPPDGWPEGMAPSAVNDAARENMAAIRTLVSDLQYVDLDNTPSYLSATSFSLGTADATNWEVGRRVKLFDATTLYGVITSVSATFVQVRLDSGALTSSLSSAALSILHNTSPALPDAAYNGVNFVYNGALDIWQRGTSFVSPTNFQYTADRFMFETGGTPATVNISRLERSANATYVPSLASAGVFLNSSLTIAVNATDAAVGAADYMALTYIVEGYDWRKMAHRPMGLAFQVNSNRSGIYAVAIRSGGSSAAFVANYTISAINTWQRVFVPIPEAPTSPFTWDYSSGAGLRITWTLMAGTNFQAAAGSWTAMNALATSSQVNFAASAANSWTIAGVGLKIGNADTPFVPHVYADDLAHCQRYYWRGLPTTALNTNAYTVGAVSSWPIAFPNTMRGTPSVTAVLTGTTWNFLDSTTYTLTAPTINGMRFLMIATAANPNCNITFGGSDYFAADSELT